MPLKHEPTTFMQKIILILTTIRKTRFISFISSKRRE